MVLESLAFFLSAAREGASSFPNFFLTLVACGSAILIPLERALATWPQWP